jgi:hypothetical protein
MGRSPSLAPADQGSLTTDGRLHITYEMRYGPGCLPVSAFPSRLNLPSRSPWALLSKSNARPAERLLALHLHQRAHLRHITIWTFYREGSIPAVPRHWLRLFASASAVISIRQGCNNFDANLQQRCARGRLVLS